jgi:hypothetical protein
LLMVRGWGGGDGGGAWLGRAVVLLLVLRCAPSDARTAAMARRVARPPTVAS